VEEELAHRRATKGDTNYYTTNLIDSLNQLYDDQGRYEEAERLWKEELVHHRATKGDTSYEVQKTIHSWPKFMSSMSSMKRPSSCGRRGWHFVGDQRRH